MQTATSGADRMLRLETGEEVFEELVGWARTERIRAAAVPMGLGQFTRATIGFWTGHDYDRRTVEEPVELVGLSGSIAEVDDAPSVHLHATLGLPDHSTLSGHLIEGRVGLLAELLVVTFPRQAFGRRLDPESGLRRLELPATGRGRERRTARRRGAR